MCCEGAGRAGAEALCQVRGSKELAPPDDRSRVLLPLEVQDLCHLRPHSATRVLVVSVDCCGTGVSRAGICLPRGPHAAPAACCPGLPRGPQQATARWSPPSAACAPWIIERSRRVLKAKIDLPFLPLSFLRTLSRALPFLFQMPTLSAENSVY
jgi:hypothetical protein